MAKRLTMRQQLSFKIQNLSDSEVAEALDLISSIQSTKKQAEEAQDDALISFLEDAQENRRARQAYEWEQARRRAEVNYYTAVSSGSLK